jgi:hypothetical protein
VKEFLMANLPAMIRRRVFDQTSSPGAQITWQSSIGGNLSPATALQEITNKTGLRFTTEKREMEMIVLADGAGGLAKGQ